MFFYLLTYDLTKKYNTPGGCRQATFIANRRKNLQRVAT